MRRSKALAVLAMPLLISCSAGARTGASSAFCRAVPTELSGALSGSSSQDPATVAKALDAAVDAWDRMQASAPSGIALVVDRLGAYTRHARETLAAPGYAASAATPEQEEAERQLGQEAIGAADDYRTFKAFVQAHCGIRLA